MKCPYCGQDSDRVVDTRSRNDGRAIRRRRQCLSCHRRFITVEEIETRRFMVIKSDGRREPYDRNKLLQGIEIACSKRPISMDKIEEIVARIELELQSEFSKEIESRQIGESVIRHLKQLDEVAYVRFASVYRKFKDKDEFLKELHGLKKDFDTN